MGVSRETLACHVGLLILCGLSALFKPVAATSDPVETEALQAFHKSLIDPDGHLDGWNGNDPCSWNGVYCNQVINNVSHVTELRLFELNLQGTLVPELGNLSELVYLDVMWNNLTGSIPSSFGNLKKLFLLLLNGNHFTGILPPELGYLSNLNRIQIDQNNISGPVPTTFENLSNIQHLHMNNNSLNGSLPAGLGKLPKLVHILLDNNHLTGDLPPEIAKAPSLLIIQLDNNHFSSNATIPSEWGNIPTLLKLSLRNCGLNGTIPDLSGLTSLEVLDLSLNTLTGPIPNNSIRGVNLSSIDLSNNGLSGQIPATFGDLQHLQYLVLKDNNLGGPIPQNLGNATSFQSNKNALIDLQNNSLSLNTTTLAHIESTTGTRVWLAGNTAICSSNESASNPFCVSNSDDNIIQYDVTTTVAPSPTGCSSCSGSLVQAVAADNTQCRCVEPITVGYRLKSPGFTFFDSYDSAFNIYISSGLNLSSSQVVLQNYEWQPGPRLFMTLLLLPKQNNTFNQSEFDRLYNTFSNWKIPDSPVFGPYELISFNPRSPSGPGSSSKHLSAGAIVGIVVGCAALTAITVGLLLLLMLRRRRRAVSAKKSALSRRGGKTNLFLKVTGVKAFTLEELAQATDQFSEKNQVGQGGYGKVYKGVLEDGQMVAIKRAQEGSLQGAHEFYTEIELLSRVHHRNLVMLVGYCDDEGEQMLVYEYMAGGTLRDHISPASKDPMDFATRLRLALGSAKGILYLHTEANPPIFHRDIKASNILLDERKTAKVADFGLSRLAPVPDLEGATPAHVSTVVKGTPGYLDPEYFLTHKLTDKSDVYSFGVVLLELITGMQPIYHGKNIVREVNFSYEAGSMLSIVDARMGHYPSEALEPLVRLALKCCKDDPDDRPNMAEVVRDLEDIWRATPGSDTYSIQYGDAESVDLGHAKGANSSSMPDTYPFMSSEVEGSELMSELMSGTVMHVTPR